MRSVLRHHRKKFMLAVMTEAELDEPGALICLDGVLVDLILRSRRHETAGGSLIVTRAIGIGHPFAARLIVRTGNAPLLVAAALPSG